MEDMSESVATVIVETSHIEDSGDRAKPQSGRGIPLTFQVPFSHVVLRTFVFSRDEVLSRPQREAFVVGNLVWQKRKLMGVAHEHP